MSTSDRPGNQNQQGNSMTSGVTSTPAPARSGTQSQRQRHDGQSIQLLENTGSLLTAPESWIEVSSHPSSSSVSSLGDEIVTTGLRVGSSAYARRRRLHPQSYNHLLAQQQQQQQQQQLAAQVAAGTGSQDEYEESETDSDHVLTSSTENITSTPSPNPTPLRNVYPAQTESSDEEDDDDENSTALGSRRPSEPFRPQPNAFTHPPSHLQHRHSTSSAIPQHHPRPSFSQRSNTRVDRRSPNFTSPNYQADNDEALRASLTTLLSCAAAARGLKEDNEKKLGERTAQVGSQPVNLRFVPESELMDPAPRPTAQGRVLRSDPSPSPPTTTRSVTPEKVKRPATPPQSSGKSPRATKKKKTNSSPLNAEETLISPTLMTWVMGAGVVVLVSVVGFGAGYVIGREVGRQEVLSGLGAGNASVVSDGGSCGREVIRSSGGTLKRFRWGSGMGKAVVA
ncbi:hypothetical protein BKA67DRAFT_35935 [Truncatella angustata]|uniref:Uncharacterized protein n=1 Tax=Truncatella angustata TaxID=152316 RepID=A0A9P8UVI2_9PEZI|nr:uncharacterized protein BKA67DRAFT_35935 [Truncatella angustata]KAH6660009.1 hypothetical protein BKA67DRAFT_35935 [Truncatella angustata]KAH8199566.1 hypothetical protein TruAng_006263 [Truncatella angustata]